MKTLFVSIPNLQGVLPVSYLPLGPLSLATIMRQHGLEAEILDINAIGDDPHFLEAPEAIMRQTPDVVGFSTMCNSYHTVLRLARRCKEINPEVRIIFGGPHASSTAQETVERFPQVDLVVRGEAENTIVEVIKALPHLHALERLPGLTFKDGDRVINTPSPDPIKDLDTLPPLDYSLFPTLKSQTSFHIEAARGCPYPCSFCSSRNLFGEGFRSRSPENLVRSLKDIVHEYGIRDFIFVHNAVNIHRHWLLEFCRTVNRENLDIGWTSHCRIDLLDEELLERMAAAGCERISFGVETGSPRMQKLMRKNLRLDRVANTARLIMDNEIKFLAFFIVGFPEESLEDLVQTIMFRTALNFVNGSKYKATSLYLLIPFRGGRLYKENGHAMPLDEFTWIRASFTEDDMALIKAHPDIFYPFYHYHTPHLSRDMVVRVPYVLKNLDYLLYTCFMLWQDPDLGFPLTLLKSPLLQEIPGEQGDQRIGELADLRLVCRFIENVVRELGFSEHPIFEVIKYDLTLEEVLRSEAADTKMVVDFSYDIIGLVEGIKAKGFTRLPAEIKKMDNSVYFYKKGRQVNAIRVPSVFESLVMNS